MGTADERAWKDWRERRADEAAAPHGPLSLTGTHWLADARDGAVAGLPGRWRADGDSLVLTAAASDGLTVDGTPVDGEVVLSAGGPGPEHGGRRLAVVRPEGEWGVRIFDPGAPARAAFAGIDAFDHDPGWSLPAVFRPYDRGRTVRVPNADGRTRGLGLAGDLVFTVGGDEHTLAVAVEGDGSLWGVVADATSGRSTFRFRFVRPPAPGPDGSVQLDFNRAQLPPCAFGDGFLCPFPPPGNTLPFPVEAGEKAVLTR